MVGLQGPDLQPVILRLQGYNSFSVEQVQGGPKLEFYWLFSPEQKKKQEPFFLLLFHE